MTSFKLTIAYDGTELIGWQRQAAGRSVQGLIEDALRVLDGRDVAVAGAGRTDAGVHALGQVASCSLERTIDAATLLRAVNAKLPPEVRIVTAEEAPSSFHARFAARSKSYRYYIWNGDVLSPFNRRYAWHLVGALDVEAMAHAAEFIEGQHDFAAFQTGGGDATMTVRRVFQSRLNCGLRSAECGVRNTGNHSALLNPRSVLESPPSALVTYDITGDGFLRHMVRAIVGSLVEVGRRRRPPEWVREVLTGADRRAAGPTAPPHGLFLVSVQYGNLLAGEP
jgi:tRNA pseudouridine38-40 synthase